MQHTLTEYETTVVLRPDLTGETIEATLDKVRNAVNDGGKLLAINHWGKKRLAYEIEKHTRGIYVHTHYLGVGATVSEIERNLRLSEEVLRFLTVKLEDGIAPEERTAKEYVKPEYSSVTDDVDDEDDNLDIDAVDDDDAGDDDDAKADEE